MMTTPTIELLALPAWNAVPRTLDDWRNALAAQGLVTMIRRSEGETWLLVESPRLRGYVTFESQHLEAINFEIHDPDPEPATQALDEAAQLLGWEIHPDEPEEDDVDED